RRAADAVDRPVRGVSETVIPVPPAEEPRMSNPETDRRTMPAAAAIAANTLLDAVISQTGDPEARHATTSDAETDANVQSMETALGRLVGSANDDDALVPDAGDIALSSVVCISWLAARLAQASGSELELVIAELREFIDSVRVD
ncbi:MAG: hypothetical protein Q7T55_01785, partial [Solirubrobacteraceae bacterium]|nr:hypothetical protein [Solirubrobacteraceae bacterium]